MIDQLSASVQKLIEPVIRPESYVELGVIVGAYLTAYILSYFLKSMTASLSGLDDASQGHPIKILISRIGRLIPPLTAIILLKLAEALILPKLMDPVLTHLAISLATLVFFYSCVSLLVPQKIIARFFLLVGLPVLSFHLTGVLDDIVAALDSMSLELGNIRISVYGLVRVVIFGSLLFWLGRMSNKAGKKIIRNQQNLDIKTKELFSKLFEIGIFFVVFMMMFQIMGINLTTLAVFGGAVGVGLGFGLQAIASNFISGVIILLDRSVAIGDYIELEDGRVGTVTELSLRSTTLETYDGKDIVVPNEKFITSSFVNWTHKNKKQRYRVDFSVAYDTDIRHVVDIIKDCVSEHPQVLSGEEFPIEERPDCEIDSFGDSGINMFVEFWMEDIDDGKNRVGGDLLLNILETLRDHNVQIPFPQREVRLLNS